MFDAGAIEARLTIDRSQFNRELAGAEADVKKFESGRHEVKISAVFDNASVSKARQAFASLDQAISKDAMSRLRSSPQGSVLGSLNALFSPHPVTGAPSPQQAAQSGLLGKMISAPGGGGPATIAGSNRSSLRTTNSTVATVLGVNDTQLKADAAKAGRDAADSANQAAATEARKKGSAWLGGLLGGAAGFLAGAIGGGSRGGGTAAGGHSNDSSGSFLGNLAGGIGPAIPGVGLKSSAIIGLGAPLLGAVPALLAGLAPLVAAAPAIGLLALGAKNLIGTKNQAGQPATQGALYNSAQTAKSAFTGLLSSAETGLVGPLGTLFNSLPKLLAPIGPALKDAFNGAATLIQPLTTGLLSIVKSILPQLGGLARAAAPSLAPLLAGLGKLIGNFLPGLLVLVKAASPAVTALASVFGTLGKDLGSFFAALAPALGPSSVLLKAVFGIIGGLLPVIAKLAGLIASALAPVFIQFAKAIQALMPFLIIVGKVLASLAGAILGDLVSAFTALASLLVDISPALTSFAKAFSQVFTVLENTGVFAILGDAVEALAKPLAGLISALLNGLTPLLPPIIKFISQLSSTIATSLVAAVLALLPPLLTLATSVLGTLAVVLPIVLPLLLKLATIFTQAVVSAIAGIATALADILKAIPPSVLGAIVVGILAIVGALKLWAIIQAVIDTLLVANPIGLVVIAIGLLVVAIVALVTHWSTVWHAILSVMDAAVSALGVAWHAIASTATAVWNAIASYFTSVWNGIIAGFKTDISTVESAFSTAWNAVTSALKTAWNAIASFFTNFWNSLVASFRNTISTVESVLSGGWNTIKSVTTSVWNGILGVLKNFWAQLSSGFRTAVSAVKTIWAGIEAAAKTPVDFVIGTVYNHGIVPVVDAIAGVAGLHPLNAIAGFAGGTAGAPPGWAWVGERGPELVHMTGGETVLSNEQSMASGIGTTAGYAAGTVPPVIPGAGSRFGPIAGVAGVTSSIVNGLRGLAGDALAAGMNAVINPLINAIPGAGTKLGGYVKTDIKQVETDLVNWVKGATQVVPGGKYLGPGSSNYAADITAVLKQLGLPLSLVSNWLTQIQTESGGNLSAVNRTDSNAIAGHPSVGLLQLIPSTFAAYAGPYLNTPPLVNEGGGFVSLNPMAQIYAAIRYAATAYDGAAMAGVIGHGHGYARGGWINEPVVGYGINSGDMYTLGEHGSEYVNPAGGRRNGDGASLDDVVSRLERLIGVTAAVPARTGAHVGSAINGSAQNASFRSRYPHGGA